MHAGTHASLDAWQRVLEDKTPSALSPLASGPECRSDDRLTGTEDRAARA